MTTIKTIAIAAMMIIATATAYANNNTKNNVHGKPVHAPVATVHHNVNHNNHECRCRECEDMRYRMRMERLHRETRGPVHGCSCHKCEDMRHHMTHKAPNKVAPAPARVAGGGRL